jgi:hypothetical protein
VEVWGKGWDNLGTDTVRSPTAIIFISGPIGNEKTRLLLRNLGRFFQAEAQLLAMNMAPINPAADIFALTRMPEWFLEDNGYYWQTLMQKDKTMIGASHGLYQLPGWTCSGGAVTEFTWAKAMGIPFSEDINEICEIAIDYRDSHEQS